LNNTYKKYRHLKSGAIYVPAQYISIARGAPPLSQKKNGLPYNVNEMTHEDFFICKHYQVPLEAIFKNN
jgi:hypothetical protein